MKLSEGNVQCPLVGSDLSSAIERQVDAFTNADSSDASEQESIGIQGVCPAQFLLESSVIFRRQGSGKILRARRKIRANNETGWDEMALGGRRRSTDFIGFRPNCSRALFRRRFTDILVSVRNHLGDLPGVGLRSSELRRLSVSPLDNGVPKWLCFSSSSATRLPPCIDQVQ